jgi:hypothetical protein
MTDSALSSVLTLANAKRNLRAAHPHSDSTAPASGRPTSLNMSKPLGDRFPRRTVAGPNIAAAPADERRDRPDMAVIETAEIRREPAAHQLRVCTLTTHNTGNTFQP